MRDELPRFLIVCEGECTEPNYFLALAADLRLNVAVRVVGLGDNTDNLVERTIELKNEDDYFTLRTSESHSVIYSKL